ncbi:MAG TPA: glutathione S-transferase family protein [Rhodospirillales bacterium]|nr:glutathione S-transferase family protein [Alphaproteobacteria bacterium]HIA80508.1 glutathione S-transferase family protein [Rhodospirillales bacterium]HIC60264.1 glutathione S-transferase family protein [Rhodospirillales bacterium]HIP08326.1 glutathione S-transferase family protein [Rhodospirillales bacterium]|tara:strand:- start:303 stop:914 length:612 start_codon:yes stop_codon:yes gene_type:complete
MDKQITLYGTGTTRSSRCRWTLLELGLDFDYVDNGSLIGTAELKKMQPLGKLPAIVIGGESLFESTAICTYLCDLYPNKNLIASVGSRQRALHEQWCSFALTEIEGYLWSSSKHKSLYPAEKRVAAVLPINTEEIIAGLAVLENTLNETPYLTGSNFSVTDIIVGFTVNWARSAGHLETFPVLSAYLERLHERELCTFKQNLI